MSLIKGIHHVSLKCCNEAEYKEEIAFYKDVLELEVARQWDAGIMLDSGNGLIEIFNDGEAPLPKGTIRHFAFATDDVESVVENVSKAGYEVFIKPKDIVNASEPEFPAWIAVCKGPLGEEIEFFCERGMHPVFF